jgi:hypothetical protein
VPSTVYRFWVSVRKKKNEPRFWSINFEKLQKKSTSKIRIFLKIKSHTYLLNWNLPMQLFSKQYDHLLCFMKNEKRGMCYISTDLQYPTPLPFVQYSVKIWMAYMFVSKQLYFFSWNLITQASQYLLQEMFFSTWFSNLFNQALARSHVSAIVIGSAYGPMKSWSAS